MQQAISNPKEEVTRWERFLIYLWQIARQGVIQLSSDRANMMAASLTYRTLFGLLPVTVVGAGVARGVMGSERFESFLHSLIHASGLNQVALDEQSAGAATLGQWISDIVSSGMDINIAALTWVGVLVLIYSSIALMSTIETCFNYIFKAEGGRSWMRRIPLYWFILTFGPVLLAVAFWAESFVSSSIETYLPANWLHWLVSALWKFSVTWFVMYTLYTLVPTVKVLKNAAMIGAFVATILILIGKGTLGLYFNHALSLKQLYGSLGLVPVFMFWIYLMWLITLLGLQVTSIVQNVALERQDSQN